MGRALAVAAAPGYMSLIELFNYDTATLYADTILPSIEGFGSSVTGDCRHTAGTPGNSTAGEATDDR